MHHKQLGNIEQPRVPIRTNLQYVRNQVDQTSHGKPKSSAVGQNQLAVMSVMLILVLCLRQR
jgi:hypothetical protein